MGNIGDNWKDPSIEEVFMSLNESEENNIQIQPCGSEHSCELLESFVSKDPIEDIKEEIMNSIIATSKEMSKITFEIDMINFEASNKIEKLKESLDRLGFMNQLTINRLMKLENGEKERTIN